MTLLEIWKQQVAVGTTELGLSEFLQQELRRMDLVHVVMIGADLAELILPREPPPWASDDDIHRESVRNAGPRARLRSEILGLQWPTAQEGKHEGI